jgi:hypothetical protein
MCDETKPVEVTIKYLLPDHEGDYSLFDQRWKMYDLIMEIQNKLRNVIKYEDDPSEDRYRLAEEIRAIIRDANLRELP